MSGSFEGARLVHGLVPTCAVAELQDRNGRVVDSATMTVERNRPPRQRTAARFYPVVQIQPGTPDPGSFDFPEGFFRYGLNAVLYDASVTFAHDPGVQVTPRRISLDTVAYDVHYVVTTEPGLHPVIATIRAGNGPTSRRRFTVYAPGRSVPRPTGSLAGRSFTTRTDSVSFLDDEFAYVGVPPNGVPRCTAADVTPGALTGCLPYRWNVSSNLLRIGDWLGAVDFAPRTRELRGVYWYGTTYCQDSVTPTAGLTLDGTYQLSTGDPELDPYGDDDYLRVHFTPDGRYELLVRRFGSTPDERFLGAYAVGPDGRLDLTVDTPSGGRPAVGSIGVHSDSAGRPRPDQGLVLDLDDVAEDVHGNFIGGPGFPTDLLGLGASAPAPWTPARFGNRTLTCTPR